MQRGLDKYIHWNQGNKIVDVRDLTILCDIPPFNKLQENYNYIYTLHK